jgi:hypothetical protein
MKEMESKRERMKESWVVMMMGWRNEVGAGDGVVE